MPSLAAFAQRVRYPNGTHSGMFITRMSKLDMVRIAEALLSDSWPDDLPDESARLSVGWSGRFWGTARIWTDREHPDNGLLGGNDESGYHTLYALGIPDVNAYLARSVLHMAKSIEEATGWK